MMKFGVIIFFFIFSVILARGQETKDLLVSETYQNQSLSEILINIGEKYSVQIFYKEEWLTKDLITVSFSDTPISEVISELIKDQDLNYLIYFNAIIIAPEKKLNQEFSREYFLVKSRQQNLLKSKKWSTAISIKNIGDSTLSSLENQVIIVGEVVDGLSGEPLTGVNLHFESLNYTTTTNELGRFQVKLPTGYNPLEISYIGYETQKIVWRVFDKDNLKILLAPEAYELDELLITGEADDYNVQSVIMGITRLRPQQIENMPVFLGEPDVIKGLLTLPGISTIGEGAGGFNVRGGSIDQNLILQDEAMIFNSSHALGFFSIFNSDAIQEVELYKGHIPAQYGGRLSSVLNVKLKGNNAEKLTAKGGIGLVSSRLVLEGPIRSKKSRSGGQTPRTTFLLGGRITYSDWVLRIMAIPDIKNSSAYFYDFNMKITHRYSEKGLITGTYYQSYDKVQFSDDYGFSWKNHAASLIWNHMISPTISSTFSASMGNNDNLSYEPTGLKAFTLTNGITDLRLKEDILISSFQKHNLITGFEYNNYNIKSDRLLPLGDQSTLISESVEKDDGHELGIYINDEYILNHLFSFSFGLRYNLFQQLGPGNVYIYREGIPKTPESIIDTIRYGSGEAVKTFQNWMPRFSMKYSLSPSASLKLSYNRTSQFIHLVSNSTAALPVDFWLVSGPYYAPETSNNFSIGYFRNFLNNAWETSLELYYRRMDNVIEYKDFAELLLNEHIETELLTGIGKAYGAELLIRRKKGALNGWFSYSYSRSFVKVESENSEESINNGDWFPSRLDKPHNLSIVLNYNFNRSNSFSANFTFSSGRPIAAPDSYYIIDDVYIPEYTSRNQYRIPDYHRLDISYTIKRNVIRKKRYKDSFTISIYNLYARKNAYSIFFRKNTGTATSSYKLSVLGTIFPSVTYNFEF